MPRTTIRRFTLPVIILTTLTLSGCNTPSAKQTIADIASQIPIAQAVVTTAAAAAQTIDPTDATLITNATTEAQSSLAQLQVLCAAYVQAPSTSGLAVISSILNSLLNDNAAALLNAAHILNPNSRNIAQATLGAVQTALLLIAAILQKSQTASQVATTAALRTYKLTDVAPFLDHRQIEQATGVPFATALHYQQAEGF